MFCGVSSKEVRSHSISHHVLLHPGSQGQHHLPALYVQQQYQVLHNRCWDILSKQSSRYKIFSKVITNSNLIFKNHSSPHINYCPAHTLQCIQLMLSDSSYYTSLVAYILTLTMLSLMISLTIKTLWWETNRKIITRKCLLFWYAWISGKQPIEAWSQ